MNETIDDTVTVTLTATVLDRTCHDVLTTALEGGIGYWSRATRIDRDDDLNVTSATIIDVERGVDVDGVIDYTYELTPAVVRKGLAWVLTSGQVHNRYHVAAVRDLIFDPDNADHDADTADMIVQAGLFDRLVYG